MTLMVHRSEKKYREGGHNILSVDRISKVPCLDGQEARVFKYVVVCSRSLISGRRWEVVVG